MKTTGMVWKHRQGVKCVTLVIWHSFCIYITYYRDFNKPLGVKKPNTNPNIPVYSYALIALTLHTHKGNTLSSIGLCACTNIFQYITAFPIQQYKEM